MIDLDKKKKTVIIETLRENNVSHAFLFGSYARNEQRASSDLDILVSLKPNYSIFDLLDIRLALEDRLGIKVDLIPDDCLVFEMKEGMLEERIRLF